MSTGDGTGTRRWIVGHDDSEPAEHALEWALGHADGRADRIEIVAAWQPPVYGPYPVDGAAALPYDDAALARATAAHVREVAAAAAGRSSVPITGVTHEGGAARVLLEASEGADLLVVGSRGRGGFRRLLLGSTSSQCVSHAECPTVVVRGPAPTATERIVVGVDGSPNSLAALEWTLAFAPPGGSILIGTVWDDTPFVLGADEYYFPDASELADERIGAMVDEVVTRSSRASSVSVERALGHGRPRDVVAEWGADADLVVVGARGAGGLGGALLGSVTTSLVHHLERPVAVIPHTGA